MASGRIKKWFKSLPLETRSDSHLARQSDASDIGPVATEATAVARDVTSDVVSPLSHLVGATTKETTLSGPAHHLGSKIADEHIKKIKRFRVLVMGRANAGKTTILHRVCNSTDQPEIFDGKGNKIENDIVQGTLTRGYHDIENELVFRSCPGFIFHDSCGFEAGSTQQFDQMSNFVVRCGATRNLNKRVHVIWFCIPMTDSHRTVTAAEQKFFNACDTGHVPVIVVLTKVDALYLTSIRELLDEGSTIAEAKARAPQKQGELLERLLAHIKYELDRCKFPPKGFVLLQKMNGEDADPTPLMECTTNMLVGGGLQRLLIATQQSQITLSIQHAVYWVVERMMLKIIKQGETPDMKSFECNILHWFPNHAIQYANSGCHCPINS
ncbi:hypothetical protein EDC04DRAFT_2807071 [Pisolithus marmoratus]|nr:hypothetical protein EDC04DRAFT_2807071 [Pisolithus marmoratus]